jgi:hypothetical protein
MTRLGDPGPIVDASLVYLEDMPSAAASMPLFPNLWRNEAALNVPEHEIADSSASGDTVPDEALGLAGGIRRVPCGLQGSEPRQQLRFAWTERFDVEVEEGPCDREVRRPLREPRTEKQDETHDRSPE